MDTSDIKDERQLLAEIAAAPGDAGVLDDAERGPDDDAPRNITPYEINSYGADYDVDGLVRRLNNEDIFIPPFQRNFVWTQADASRFVESLLLGFPVPAIFLSRESSNRFLVVDGQQRLKSLQRYYHGTFEERRFRLTGINSRFINTAYDELAAADRRTLDNALVHTIIVQQVGPAEPADEIHSSIYLLFERLNTWGRPLFPQEIRSCVDHGRFIDLLHELNDFPEWRALYGEKSKRLKDEELILRFLALYDRADRYTAPMKTFLDKYCSANRDLAIKSEQECRDLFFPAMSFVRKALGEDAFRPIKAFNAAVFDSVSVAAARRLAQGPVTDLDGIKHAYQDLLASERFNDAYSKATAREEQVRDRLALATEAFAEVP